MRYAGLGQYRSDHASPYRHVDWSRSRGRAHVLNLIYLRYFISQELHPSGIIRVHPVDPSSSHGFDPAIHRYRYPCLPCLRAPPVCVPRLSACDAQAGTGRHRQAQAGVPTAQVEDTNPKRTISIESPPCRPGAWRPSATSCRKIFRQPIGNGSIAIPIAIARRRKHGASNPLLPRHRWGNIAAIMLLDIVISIGPPRDGNVQGRWQVVRGVATRIPKPAGHSLLMPRPEVASHPATGKAQGLLLRPHPPLPGTPKVDNDQPGCSCTNSEVTAHPATAKRRARSARGAYAAYKDRAGSLVDNTASRACRFEISAERFAQKTALSSLAEFHNSLLSNRLKLFSRNR